MDKKEKVQDFNQRFAAHLNNFSATTNPAEENLIEYYSSTLYPSIAMFVKRAVNPSLEKTYEVSSKVEAKLDTIKKYTAELEVKTFSHKKTFVVN